MEKDLSGFRYILSDGGVLNRSGGMTRAGLQPITISQTRKDFPDRPTAWIGFLTGMKPGLSNARYVLGVAVGRSAEYGHIIVNELIREGEKPGSEKLNKLVN